MFLSYTVVPVFVFTVMLNFFYLYVPANSLGCTETFRSCQDCLNSTCHLEKNRTCTVDPSDKCTFLCFTCEVDLAGDAQFYTEAECTKTCMKESTKTCVCEGACYVCTANATSVRKCTMPTQAVDDKCTIVPYGCNVKAPVG